MLLLDRFLHFSFFSALTYFLSKEKDMNYAVSTKKTVFTIPKHLSEIAEKDLLQAQNR